MLKGRRVVVGLIAPFVVLPLVLRLAVGPIGDALASAFVHAAPKAVASSAPPSSDDEDTEDAPLAGEHREHFGSSDRPKRVARWSPPIAGSGRAPSPDAGAAPRSGTIVVPAAVIVKALEDKKASARDVVDSDGKPFGAKLRNVSRYHAGLQDGDIVIEIGGVRVHGVGEMTQQGIAQAAGGATKLTGKIVRGESTYDVVLELPQEKPATP